MTSCPLIRPRTLNVPHPHILGFVVGFSIRVAPGGFAKHAECDAPLPATSISSALRSSADWTVRLWEERQVEPLHTLRSIDLWDAVNDVAWSPTCSTVFASVAANGRVELWDLAQSVLDPIVSTTTNRPGQDG